MHRLMKIVGFAAVALGAAYVVKQMKERKADSSGWHKVKFNEEKRTGTRYGSNPIRY